MHFEHPQLLWLTLLVVPALVALGWWAARAKRRLMTLFVHERLFDQLTASVSFKRQRLRGALVIAAVGLLFIALARPQLGFDWEEARQKGLDIIVAIDVSRSMLADDVPPNRLARAKLAALDLKRVARSDRVGLIAFAGSAFLQCPLSYDDEVFRQSVNELKPGIIPQGGTAVGQAIDNAVEAFKEKSDNHKVLVMFTDGEDHDGTARDAAGRAREAGLRVFTVGVGTPNGELLRMLDEKGRTEFIKDEQGNVVKSRLNEALLQEVAQATGGFYLRMAGANTIELLYERGLAPLPKTEFAAQRVKRWHERYQWVLGLAIVLLFVQMFVPERKTQRRPAPAPGAQSTASATVRLVLFLLIASASAALAAPSASSALKKYHSGRYDSALGEYERLLKKKPEDAALHFNAGAAAYQSREFDQAQQHLNQALLSPNVNLQQQAYYNLGNTQFRLGEEAPELPQKEQLWRQATNSYTSAVALNTNDIDARVNLEIVRQRLEELKRQQQQQQQQQQQKQDGQDNKQEQPQDSQQNQQDQQQQQDRQQPSQGDDQQKSKDQQQQEQPPQQQKQDGHQQQPQPEPQPKQGGEQQPSKEDTQPGEKGQEGQPLAARMTPQQAQQLLDAQKGDERMVIFLPPEKTNRNQRVLKDW